MVLQEVINIHSKAFIDISKGIPPTLDYDHVIHLQLGSVLDLTSYPIGTHMHKKVVLRILLNKCYM